jgi:hypothetical protein
MADRAIEQAEREAANELKEILHSASSITSAGEKTYQGNE